MDECIVKETYFGEKQYFTFLKEGCISVVSECREVFCLEIDTANITAALFFEDTLYYSIRSESNIYYIHQGDIFIECIHLEYPAVEIRCQIKNMDMLVLALDVGKDYERRELKNALRKGACVFRYLIIIFFTIQRYIPYAVPGGVFFIAAGTWGTGHCL